MEAKQKNPESLIYYPIGVTELLHIRREFYKGIPINTVFDVEARNYKYGKEAYYNMIKKQIENVFDFTLFIDNETMPQYYDSSIEKGVETKVTEFNTGYNQTYYYFNHNDEAKILNELLEYLQSDPTPEPTRITGKPKTIVKEATFYLEKPELLQVLIDNYTNVEPKTFNQLIKSLIELNQLKPATKKEIKEAFCKELKIEQAQENFNRAMRTAPDQPIINTIKNKLKPFIQ